MYKCTLKAKIGHIQKDTVIIVPDTDDSEYRRRDQKRRSQGKINGNIRIKLVCAVEISRFRVIRRNILKIIHINDRAEIDTARKLNRNIEPIIFQAQRSIHKFDGIVNGTDRGHSHTYDDQHHQKPVQLIESEFRHYVADKRFENQSDHHADGNVYKGIAQHLNVIVRLPFFALIYVVKNVGVVRKRIMFEIKDIQRLHGKVIPLSETTQHHPDDHVQKTERDQRHKRNADRSEQKRLYGRDIRFLKK